MTALPVVVALVAAQRLAELAYARRNMKALLRQGAVEVGGGHYPLFILLHLAWMAALLLLVPWNTPPSWPVLGLFALVQGMRAWVLASLGRYFTTRIVTLPDAPLVRRGLYRWTRHPNYAVVVAEVALLPLAFGAWRIAVVFSLANLALLAWRIRIEDRALAPRRALQPGTG